MINFYLFSIVEQFQNWTHTLLFLGIGILVGGAWGLAMKWRSLGLGFSLLSGVIGAWVYLSFFMNYYTYSHKQMRNELIAATVGAIILTVSLNLIFGSNRGKDRTFWRA